MAKKLLVLLFTSVLAFPLATAGSPLVRRPVPLLSLATSSGIFINN